MPALVVQHGRFRDAVEEMTRLLYFVKKAVRRIHDSRVGSCGVDHQIASVDLLPHFRRDRFPYRASVFPRRPQTGNDRVGIVAVKTEKTNNVFPAGSTVTLGKSRVVAGYDDQWRPLLCRTTRKVEDHLQIDVNEASNIFRPFRIAA